ncbi:DUF853 family protein [Schaalia cardiffensis]|uniref:helicase HerA-like domain-containing protein n=1 Tax=Schaalia cardiffensis TaxID=181487 RepID=UPI0018E7C4A1|nr:helicase HerA-like domain-containing protein [Schaalia cardiffensis]MBJ2329403.1 DUF853 family protein [Schaalia cardiffensis]
MSENIDDLKAQLAEAEARARQAEAEAAHAQAEALRLKLEAVSAAGSDSLGEPDPADAQSSPQEPSPQAPCQGHSSAEDSSPQEASSSDSSPSSSAFIDEIRRAYDFSTPSITIGTLLDGTTRVVGTTTKMPLSMFNRHLLVAGATGTGKTRTLQLLSEGLSAAGSSVLLCDVKGDLSGLAEKGASSEKLLARTAANGQDWTPDSFPIDLLTLGDAKNQFTGIPIRTSLSDFGPLLLARALGLNSTQEQALQLIFAWADKEQLELIDLPDLRTVISFLTSEEGAPEFANIGGVSKATTGVILRALTVLESQGAEQFFGAPSFDTHDLLRLSPEGRGVISLLDVGDISQRPALVSALIMWLLADLYSTLPEVGDLELPRLVFFFDEAHLLFADATKEFIRQVVQTVRLIRSKGVGVVFVTQTPKDIPADVLAQISSRIQHGLRALTPDEHKRLKASVQTFPNTSLDLAEILTNLGTGQAVVTVLNEHGTPTPVSPTSMWAPASLMGPASAQTLALTLSASPIASKYSTAVNPDSAQEKLMQRMEEAEAEKARLEAEKRELLEAEKAAAMQAKQEEKERAALERALAKEKERAERAEERAREKAEAERQRKAERRAKQVESVIGQVLRTAGSEITRSVFGTRRR